MPRKRIRLRSIQFGDPRIFFETTLREPYESPNGIHYDRGAVVRGSAFFVANGKRVSASLPSMSKLIFSQASKELEKAAKIKNNALRAVQINGIDHISDEESLYSYLQLCCLGILGLYSSIEAMVYELYVRRSDRKIIIKNQEISIEQLSSCGFEAKCTAVAAQLSGQANIYGTELHKRLKQISELRTNIQHWNIPYNDRYFTDLPEKHPLKSLTQLDTLYLVESARLVLEHYELGGDGNGDGTSKSATRKKTS